MAKLQQRTVRLCAVLAAASVLGAGAANAPGAASAPLAPDHLMALAFPGWTDHPSAHVQTVSLPGPAPGAGRDGWSAGQVRVIAEPKLVLRLDNGRLMLIAGLAPAGEDGKPAASQLTPMALASYQFEQRGGAWTLIGRQGVFAWRGFNGTANVQAVALSAQRQGIGIEYGSCWDGYCGTWMALYEVDKGAVRREPAVELALSGSNADSTADCARRLQPLVKPGTPALASAPVSAPAGGRPDSHDCYAIESSWTVDASHEQPGDLVVRYQGAMSRAEAYLAPPAPVDQRQVLRYGSGKYRAVSGFNPVPPI
ncbi:hypothetical protein AB595_26520 [Massilia sp. WF1]|uniref:hypothetical protein n=1 Tax=unclassified Massilia TaxID=2609279 RepID=UPI00069173B4|nr:MULTISPECIES: hypothetical protein [unclassified Massilia]ALK95329.1 hypothetical protein AM586_02520 [Massilia sp. WG5]KNZ67339.1 hypothetical protein AB595_26520 [Massilia sp. WF1]